MSFQPAEIVNIIFQLIAFLFAISIHESAHAWMASRCGDQTARMLGRVTLNPVKHIDPIGTVVMPLVAAFTHIPVLGWAKPTPVDPRNFRRPVADDILTSVAGPISNFVVAAGATVVLLVISLTSQHGRQLVHLLAVFNRFGFQGDETSSILVPVTLFFYELMLINVVLAVFNLIPVPPLDGSHVLRHFLSDPVRRAYDSVGIFALLALIYLGGGLLWKVISPFVNFFNAMLVRI
jgi:Zn-dependent protease